MEETFYNIEELIAITGLSKDHLTDSDGPIARICRAFPEASFGDRKQGLNYEGLQYLNEYLEALEEGIGYEEWVKQANKSVKSGGLVAVPTLQTEIVGADDDIANSINRLENLRGQFAETAGGYRGYYKNLGQLVGGQVVAEFSDGVADAIESGLKSVYEKLKLT